MNFIDLNYIDKCIYQLAKYTEEGRPFTRLVFSDEFTQGRSWLTQKFKELNLITRIDYAGNLIGVFKSNTNSSKKILIGSHIDTVAFGGKYDGIAGVVSGLAIIKSLLDNSIELPFDIEIYDYLGEELNDWNMSCIGSRGICGALSEGMLNSKNSQGIMLRDEINRIGGNTKYIDKLSNQFQNVLACFELHIEQGIILENKGIDIGVVESMPNISRHKILIKGQPGHSGTTLMENRKDALVIASKLILFINNLAKKISKRDNRHFVATVGKIEVSPNYVTIIPSHVEFIIDLRVVNETSREYFLNEIKKEIKKLTKMENFKVNFQDLMFSPYIEMNKVINESLKKSAKDLNYTFVSMDSGAGHDTAHLAKVSKASIIFIPCKNGLSHCPEEYAKSLNIKKGSEVILKSILDLKNNYDEKKL